jgi:hypothetical protein
MLNEFPSIIIGNLVLSRETFLYPCQRQLTRTLFAVALTSREFDFIPCGVTRDNFFQEKYVLATSINDERSYTSIIGQTLDSKVFKLWKFHFY